MGLSHDEERRLLKIEQSLSHEDPVFAWRAMTVRWRMRFREVAPFVLLAMTFVMAVVLVLAVACGEASSQTTAG